MTSAQKLIKYLALAFAVFLVCAIALGLFEGINALLGIEVTKDIGTKYLYSYDIPGEVNEMEINISAADLRIIEGDKLSVNTVDEDIMCVTVCNILKIGDKKSFKVASDGAVVIEIPDVKQFERVKLSAGAGEVTVKSLVCEKLRIDLGAGDASLNELFVSGSAEINCAAGEFSVRSGEINGLDMELAVGDVSLECGLTGKSEINCGIGDINIILPEEAAFYRIKLDKGVCTATFNGKAMEDDTVYGDGENRIEIDGAVGDISIRTAKK